MSVKRLVVVGSTALLLVVAGCGGGGDPEAEGSPTVEGAASAVPSEPDEASGGYDADELVAAMMAAVAEKQTAHVTIVLGGVQGMRGEGDMTLAGAGGASAMQMTVEAPQLGGSMEMRMVDGVMYLSIPPMTPKGKFIKADPNDPSSPFGGLGSLTQGDPLAALEGFEAGLQDVKYVGQETLDGEDVHHYVLTVDARKAAEAQGQPAPPGAETTTYDLWIDGDDLIRRMEFGAGASGVVISMSDWGKPVTVEEPADSDIVQMPQMSG